MAAILRYNKDGLWWEAVVDFRVDEGFVTTIRTGHAGMPPAGSSSGGAFKSAPACVKYLRELAGRKFPGLTPTIDTMGTLKAKVTGNVVPECFEAVAGGLVGPVNGFPKSECWPCPYRTTCSGPQGRLVMSGADVGASAQEDDSDFLKRLQEKVRATFQK